MSFKLGMEGRLYFSSTLLDESTQPGTLTWDEQANVRDVTINLETGEADVTTRANNGWRATRATLKDGSIEFEMVWDSDDPGFTAVKDAWLSSGEIAIAAMDGDIGEAGNQGLASNFTVTNFSRSEPLEEAITVSVTLKPSSFTQWYTVGTP
ncbi:MAG: phage tail tube protein [Phycisphaeraceae bacterium]